MLNEIRNILRIIKNRKDIKIVWCLGGLGNQMFQYASVKYNNYSKDKIC